jgi:hypothetical protein
MLQVMVSVCAQAARRSGMDQTPDEERYVVSSRGLNPAREARVVTFHLIPLPPG